MELWIGPVIVAAAVSALVSVAGWFVTFGQSVKLERLRRAEKVNDFQIALRAEIASDLLNLNVVDWPAYLADIEARYAADPSYSVVVPHMATNLIFAAIVRDIHILPGNIIAPVVAYTRLRETVEQFVADMRSEKFSQLSSQRQLLMYSDYLNMLERLEALAAHAVAAIDVTLGTSIQDEARSNPKWASEQAAAGAQDVAEDEP